MNDKKKKLIRDLLILSIMLVFLYLVIAIPCITQLAWKENKDIYLVDKEGKVVLGSLTPYGQCIIALMVLIPLLVAIICGILSETIFKVYTEEQANNDYKKQMRYGLIDNEQYMQYMLNLKNKSLENKKKIQEEKIRRAKMEIDLKKIEEQAKEQAKKELTNIIKENENVEKNKNLTNIQKNIVENPKMY